MSKFSIPLQWMAIEWPRPYDINDVWELLSHLATLSPHCPLVWEVRGTGGQVRYQIGVKAPQLEKIKGVLHAHGDIHLRDVSNAARKSVTITRALKISHPILSLKTDVTMAAIRTGLAAMAEMPPGEEMVLQVMLGKAFAPSSVSPSLPDPTASWLDQILGNVHPATPEQQKSAKQKAEQHRFNAAIRLGASGRKAVHHVHAMLSAFRVLETAGVRIYAEADSSEKLNHAIFPRRFPLRLSVKELVSFLLLPIGDQPLPGTAALHPRSLFPPGWYSPPIKASDDRSFAMSLDTADPKKLSISPKDSLLHTVLLGPTGSGKSTAMQHLILSDINAGRSVLVIDPKADLVNDILARIPEERTDDVVVIDPSDPAPVGFNPLAFKNYENPPLLADAILSVLKELWADNWGVRIQDILSAALLTLVEVEGSSLLWLPAFLTDADFRQKITSQVKDRVALKPFWEQFDALKDYSRQQQIEPVLNKLRQFTLRPGLRNVLGQAKPKFSLTDLFYQRKIVLVSLNKGLVGGECSRCLGSLIVGLTWTLALSRAKLPPEKRHIVSVYIDELQDYLSLPTDLSDALAQARGLGLGLTLAHQYRDQLPLAIRSGIDANALNKIVFGLNATDAKAMAAMAPELTAEDFMMLPRYQVYTTLQYGGRATGWMRGQTLPPVDPVRLPADLKALSQKRYGKPAAEVEQEYLDLFIGAAAPSAETVQSPIGRRKKA